MIFLNYFPTYHFFYNDQHRQCSGETLILEVEMIQNTDVDRNEEIIKNLLSEHPIGPPVYDQTELSYTNIVRYLGIYLFKRLTWNPQICF